MSIRNTIRKQILREAGELEKPGASRRGFLSVLRRAPLAHAAANVALQAGAQAATTAITKAVTQAVAPKAPPAPKFSVSRPPVQGWEGPTGGVHDGLNVNAAHSLMTHTHGALTPDHDELYQGGDYDGTHHEAFRNEPSGLTGGAGHGPAVWHFDAEGHKPGVSISYDSPFKNDHYPDEDKSLTYHVLHHRDGSITQHKAVINPADYADHHEEGWDEMPPGDESALYGHPAEIALSKKLHRKALSDLGIPKEPSSPPKIMGGHHELLTSMGFEKTSRTNSPRKDGGYVDTYTHKSSGRQLTSSSHPMSNVSLVSKEDGSTIMLSKDQMDQPAWNQAIKLLSK